MAIRKLVVSQMLASKMRAALTVAAVAVAVSLVVAMTSGFTSIEAAAVKMLERVLGATDVIVTAEDPTRQIDQTLADRLAADPEVDAISARLETSMTLPGRYGGIAAHRAKVVGVDRPEARAMVNVRVDAGRWLREGDDDVVVIDDVLAHRLRVELGETMLVPSPTRPRRMTIVGISGKPGVLNIEVPTIYLPLDTLQPMVGAEGKVNRVFIDLTRGAKPAAFIDRWRDELGENDPPLHLRAVESQREALNQNLLGLHMVSYFGGAVAMVAAVFIVFSTLSMGLTERSRLLAMLRAIGAQRWQVGTAVVIEGLVLAAVGGAVGVPLGLLWLQSLVARFGGVLTAGAVVSFGGIAFAAGGILLASLVASLLPAAIASRLKPLEAMAATARPPARSTPWISAAAGLIVIAIDVLLIFTPIVPRAWKLHAHAAVGLPTLMIGLFLIAPLIVTAVERIAGPPLAWALRLNRPLARQQLAHGVWRAAGTAAALMVGLIALVVIHTHGNNVLNAWRLPTRFPDLLVFAAFGLDEPGVEKLRHVQGIRGDQVMPIAVTTPELGMNIFGLAGLAQAPNATIFMGIDPDQAFGTAEEDRGMFEAEFIEGDVATARRLLKQGRHVIVSEEYRQLQGLGVGDKIKLGSPRRLQYEYTVAGVVRAPGVDLIIRMFDIEREFEQWTAASVIGSLQRAREDFGHSRYHLFAVNLEPGVDKEVLERRLKARLATWGLLTADARAIKAFVEHHVRQMLALVSVIAFAAIAVAALGVVNTIMASIRVRQWQFGVLRSIGLTRGQLLRFVLLEAGLLGIAASVLGAGGGLLLAYNAGGLAERIVGVAIPYAPAWSAIFIGVGITITVAVIAGLVPAVRTAFARPLIMLQSGRGG